MTGDGRGLSADERIAAVLALHAPKRLYPEPRFAPWCGHCSTGQVSHYDDGSFTHQVDWPCPTVLALCPDTTKDDMEAVQPIAPARVPSRDAAPSAPEGMS